MGTTTMNREGRRSDGLVGEPSRRTFVTRGTLAAGALALGLPGERAAAQVDGDETQQRALLYRADFRPGGRFRAISPPIDWRPVGEEPLFEANLFEEFDTRAILYVEGDGDDDGNSGDDDGSDDDGESPRFFFPSVDAEVQEDQLYELDEDATPVADAEELMGDVADLDPNERLVVVTFTTITTPEGTETDDDGATEDGKTGS